MQHKSQMKNIKKMVKKSGTSFFWGMKMLPFAKRHAMYTIYDFFSYIDDIIDDDTPLKQKLKLTVMLQYNYLNTKNTLTITVLSLWQKM